MKIKLSLCFLSFLTVLYFNPAQAGRWIVEAATDAAVGADLGLGMRAVHKIQLNGKSFLVVETPDFVPQGFSFRSMGDLLVKSTFQTEKVSMDPPIELIPAGNIPEDAEIPDAGWHVRQLHYSELPSTRNGSGITVAVLDTGIDKTHPALQSQMWTNAREIAGNGIDDDQNGYIDDTVGYDFAAGDANPSDTYGHGTHCAGIIVALPQGPGDSQGVAQGARVMAVKIIGGPSQSYLSTAALGIKYAVDNGAKILSNSWRIYKNWDNYDPSEENLAILKEAILYAERNDVIFVAAAGNESANVDEFPDAEKAYPLNFEGLANLVVVAASEPKNGPAVFSNWGQRTVHVAAPGYFIMSTALEGRWEFNSGTSMATPLVAGALARGITSRIPNVELSEHLIHSSGEHAPWIGLIQATGVIDLVEFTEHSR